MAQDKHSFILYSDILFTVEKLTDTDAGKLFKHILRYVNDLNPETTDIITQIAFEPIKQSLKRDLRHWEDIRIKRSESGKLGGRPRKQIKAKKANGLLEKQTKAKKAVTVTVTVTDTEIINNLYKSVIGFFDEDCRPKTENQRKEWLDTLAKLIRIDGHQPEHIYDVIARIREDNFWRANFLSILKLRKKNREGLMYFTVFEKRLNHGTKTNTGADPIKLAELVAAKIGAK